MKCYTLSFRIRRIYYDAIAKGEKNVEVRAKKPFWITRVKNALRILDEDGLIKAIFVCGKDSMIRDVMDITEHENATEALGREPSEQGKKDCGSGSVFAFHILM